MKRTLIQNAVVVNEGRKVLGSVVIENEKIAEILVGEERNCPLRRDNRRNRVLSFAGCHRRTCAFPRSRTDS